MGTAVKLALALVVIGVALAYARWPRINDVETGRTPQYPGLRVREYAAGEDAVARAARAAIAALPRWEVVGWGSGPGGTEIQAVAATRLLRFKDDVTVRIHRKGGRTQVSVRSRSRIGRADFGQNARNIQAFLDQLDRALVRNVSE